ncbi:uncharacterized protein LOC125139589 [Tachysurus fulvidraco]|uniref:uncharacterized protein LOC125139589 n=1 Tax=Tachysurus fulvidraco TaxID=1234273 RepID=UPI001FEEA4AA|nr:uncharacterized protein LOC125139589 [Tachysurus fulvidraco]
MMVTGCPDKYFNVVHEGSLLSEEQHSGYEHVDDELLSVKSGIKEKAEYYDDVMDTSDIISDPGRVDPPEDYDDAVTAGPIPDNVDEDEAENYDDAITADQKSVILTEDVSENYEDAVTTETNTNIITDNPEDYDDVITEEQDVGETEGERLPVYSLMYVNSQATE